MDRRSQDAAYFEGYAELSVHGLMLRDEPRTLAYQNAIEGNTTLFKDKVVLDVGAGTGILSFFAARAGARCVYALEASGIASVLPSLIKKNDLQGVVVPVRGRAEDAHVNLRDAKFEGDELATEKGHEEMEGEREDVQVDVIISEWMGFYLLHESMLDAVITARDRWLKPGGLLFPCRASLYLSVVNSPRIWSSRVGWAESKPYGFDFSPLVPLLHEPFAEKPIIDEVLLPEETTSVVEPVKLHTWDISTVKQSDIETVVAGARLEFKHNGRAHGFALWFDVEFPTEDGEGAILSTSPLCPPTHWKQTVVLMPRELLTVERLVVDCTVALTRSVECPRHYLIDIEVEDSFLRGKEGEDKGKKAEEV